MAVPRQRRKAVDSLEEVQVKGFFDFRTAMNEKHHIHHHHANHHWHPDSVLAVVMRKREE